MSDSSLDVMTASLLDALGAKAKFDEMAKRKSTIGNGPYSQSADPFRPDYEPSDPVRAFNTRALRIDLIFEDPLKTRRELEIIAAALVQALAISKDHDRGGYNQLADMRQVLRRAVQEIQHRRGKTYRPD